MTDIATIGVRADTSGLRRGQQDMRRFRQEGANTERRVSRATETISRGFRSIAIAAGGFIGIAASIRGISNALQRLDRVAKSARSIDATAGALQAVHLAASDAGVSTDEATGALQRIQRELARASRGMGNGADALARLGLEADALSAMDADERLSTLADAINSAGLSAGETSDLLRDLGARSREMGLLLLEGGDSIRAAREELEQLGVIVSEQDLRQIERTNDAMARIGLTTQAFANTVTIALAPALERMSQAFTDASGAGSVFQSVAERLGSLLSLAVDGVTALATGFADLTSATWSAEAGIVAVVAGLAALRIGLMRTGVGALVVLAGELIYQFDRLVGRTGGFSQAMQAMGRLASEVFNGIIQTAGAIPPALNAIWERMKAGFFSALRAMATQFSVFVSDLQAGLRKIPQIGEAMAESLRGPLNSLLDAGDAAEIASTQAEGAAESLDRAARDAAAGGIARINAAFEDFSAGVGDAGAGADALNNALSGVDGRPLVGAARDAGRLGGALDDVSESAGGAAGSAGAASEAVEDLTDAHEEFGAEAPRWVDGVADAWADFMVRGFRDFRSFASDILGTFRKMLRDMIAMAARNQITMSLGLAGGGVAGGAAQAATGAMGGGGGVLGAIGSAGGALIGGATNSLGALFGGGPSMMAASIGGQVSAAVAAPTLTSIAGAVGSIAGPVALAAVAIRGLIGSTRELDRGIRVTTDEMETVAESYRETERRRLFGLIRSRRTSTSELPEDEAAPITAAVREMQQGVREAAQSLGIAGDAFDGFSSRVNISLDDLNEQQQLQAIEEGLQGISDDMAAMIPGLDEFAQSGESAGETLSRLSSALQTTNGYFRFMEITMFEASLAGADMASSLVELMGGLEEFQRQTDFFVQNFYSESERVGIAAQQVRAAFDELNIGLPETREQFRQLVEAQDLTTQSGRELHAALMQIAPAFDSMLTSAVQAVENAYRELQQAVSAEQGELRSRNRELESTIQSAQREITSREREIRDGLSRSIDRMRDQQSALRDAAQEASDAVREATSLRDLLRSTRQGMTDSGSPLAPARDGAMSFLRDLASSSRPVQRTDQLERALDVASQPNEDLFGSFVDYQREFGQAAGLIHELEQRAEDQLTTAERQLVSAESAVERLGKQIERADEALDQQVTQIARADEQIGQLYETIRLAEHEIEQNEEQIARLDNVILKASEQISSIESVRSAVSSGASSVQSAVGRVTSAVNALRQAMTENDEDGDDVPGFARGGRHSGGLRIVGERGPELEATGPSRIIPNNQLMSSLGNHQSDDSELKAMLRDILTRLVDNTGRTADTLRRWDGDGIPEERPT